MPHLMSPTGVAIVLIAALFLDAASIGPNSIRDRIAWALATPTIYEGFNGSPLDQWTVQQAGKLIDTAKGMTGGAYIAGAATEAIIAMCVLGVAVLTVGALLPEKATAKFGKFATITFGTTQGYRINKKLWGSAIVLGLFSDLVGGVFGDALRSVIMFLDQIAAYLPGLLLGVS